MKHLNTLLLSFSTIIMASCGTPCDIDREDACHEAAPTDELCFAYFERWFYNEAGDACEMVAYSGCSQRGFATEEECGTCKCR